MNITTSTENGVTTIVFSGRFTFAFHSAFRNLLSSHVETISAGGRIVFDLSAVEFVDSAALGMLLLAREGAQRRSASITLRGAQGQVRRMLDVSRFDSLFAADA